MHRIKLEPNKEPRLFRFTFNALAEYEMEFNKSIDDNNNLNISLLRNIAYIGFKEGDESFNLTVKEVGQLMNMEIAQEISKAFAHDMSIMQGGQSEKK